MSRNLWIERAVSWGLPMMLIPALRYMQDVDKPKPLRKELFGRDFSAYAIGSGIYFSTVAALTKLLKNVSHKHSISSVTATTAFCLWAGVVAPKLSKTLVEKKIISTPLRDEKNVTFTQKKVNPLKTYSIMQGGNLRV